MGFLRTQSHTLQGLETFTQYLISLQVFNPEGLGPSTTIIVTTDEGGRIPFKDNQSRSHWRTVLQRRFMS